MDVKKIFRRTPAAGLGNLVFQLAQACAYHKNPYISANVLDNEFGNCISLEYFQVIPDSDEYAPVECPLYFNDEIICMYKSVLPRMIRPTLHMKELLRQNLHLLDGVTAGVNIRRGSYSEDTKQCKDAGPEHFFCSDEDLEKFIHVIRAEPGRVYVSSDSPATKNKLKEIFGEKITMNETEFVHTSDVDFAGKRTVKNLQDVYLVWFLLSMCPKLYITGGKSKDNCTGMSTYGVSAGLYGCVEDIVPILTS
jgi:hypothetical protein